MKYNINIFLIILYGLFKKYKIKEKTYYSNFSGIDMLVAIYTCMARYDRERLGMKYFFILNKDEMVKFTSQINGWYHDTITNMIKRGIFNPAFAKKIAIAAFKLNLSEHDEDTIANICNLPTRVSEDAYDYCTHSGTIMKVYKKENYYFVNISRDSNLISFILSSYERNDIDLSYQYIDGIDKLDINKIQYIDKGVLNYIKDNKNFFIRDITAVKEWIDWRGKFYYERQL